MEDGYIEESVKKRLILAGLRELLEHSAADFSLRRVAQRAQVSCAAPYRHFKDKDELISAIVAHIREDYTLLCNEINSIFGIGTKAGILELLTSAVRFWVAGDNFPSFLQHGEISSFDSPIKDAIGKYIAVNNLSVEMGERLTFSTLATFYGTVTLLYAGTYSVDEAIAKMRAEISEYFK